jgi:hypothetical protein
MKLPLALVCASITSLAGCATVKPWEREHVAKPCMQSPFGSDPMTSQYWEKVTETRTAGGRPGMAPGGGCGCTQ